MPARWRIWCRTDRHRHRPVAGDSDLAEAVKILSRVHQTLMWDRQRQTLRLRAALREYFPAAIEAFDDLHAIEAVELLARAPDPARAARLSRSQIAAALRRAGRRNIEHRAETIQPILRAEQLPQPAVVQAAYAVTVQAAVTLIAALNSPILALEGEVSEPFSPAP